MAAAAIGIVASYAAWGAPPYRLVLPKGFPMPRIPADNPLTAEKVRLGRYLFYDKRMSGSGTRACASCHRQEPAFTDGRGQAVGATGQTLARGAMSLVNAAYSGTLTWSNPNIRALEQIFGTDPRELGVVKEDLLRLIRSDPTYRALFPRAFPGEANPYRLANVAKALDSFVRTIISGGSAYDRFHFDGDANAITEAAKRGEILFYLDYGGPSCFRCHGGFNFSDAVDYVGKPRRPAEFHNTGLYNVAGQFSYPAANLGLYEHTKNAGDVGKFKAPTLRNIALTAPYMHDGSIATLPEVVDHYAAGGRTMERGPWAGVGRENPGKDALVHGFAMTAQNRADLVAFLESLTDEGVTSDPRFGDPWVEENARRQ
jgi:cytochrome c peroxidase